MASDSLEARRRLFDLYSANLAHFRPEFSGKFACPICGRIFSREAVESDSLAVDLAHVFPESCGGKVTTLTCRECNNRMGHEYDHHFAQERRLHEAMGGQGNEFVKGRVSYSTGENAGVEVARRGDGVHINFISKQTHPDHLKRIWEMPTKSGDFQFTLTTRGLDDTRLYVASLHTGYLSMFRYFGYEYCFGADTDWVRAILTSELKERPKGILVCNIPQDAKFDRPADQMRQAVGVVRYVTGLKCMGATFPAPSRGLFGRLILLPGFGEDGEKAFSQLKEMSGVVKFQFHATFSDPLKRLADPDYIAYGRTLWRDAFSDEPTGNRNDPV